MRLHLRKAAGIDRIVVTWIGLLVFFITGGHATFADTGSNDILIVSGSITDSHGKAVRGAELSLLVHAPAGVLNYRAITDDAGCYKLRLPFPTGTLKKAKIYLEVRRSAYAPLTGLVLRPVKAEDRDNGLTFYMAESNLTLKRIVSPAFWISAAVLLMVYVAIGFDLIHRTTAALAGAAILLGVSHLLGPFFPDFDIIRFDAAARAIDLNVILLLFAMMIMVGISEKTGMFQWLAYACFRLSKGRPSVLCATLMTATALMSAFLDNVTTMLLVIPVTLQIAATLDINPVALLLPEVFASNIGGSATLIGDPPNIMIGSYAGLNFLDFVQNLSLPCLGVLIVSLVFFLFYFRREFSKPRRSYKNDPPNGGSADFAITDRRLLALSLVFLGMVILLFIVHGRFEMAPGVAALLGASALLLTSRVDLVSLLEKKIEWPTLVFFAALFVVVAAAEESGLIHIIADHVRNLSQGSFATALLIVLWSSAIVSSIIDNIPFTATMLPVVSYMGTTLSPDQAEVLWWALALGACLGGNGTLIGASANVVTVGMAEKAGHKITFAQYSRVCFIPMILSILFCSFWLLIR